VRQRQQQPDGAGADQESNQEVEQNLLHGGSGAIRSDAPIVNLWLG
jgi:hypothetical protein